MCKLVIITHIKQGLEGKALEFSKVISPLISKNDSDGLGYVALGDKGLFGERWLHPRAAWNSGEAANIKSIESIEDAYNGVIIGKNEYNSFGVKTARIYSLAIHARLATCGINIANTHPFVSKDGLTALIHNGVISNANKFPLVQSTCDSEAILVQYEGHNVAMRLNNLQAAISPLQGSMAVAAYSYHTGGWNLDIFKNQSTSLHAAFIKELDTIVWCTSAGMLDAAIKTLGWTIVSRFEMVGDTAVRHDALTGTVLDTLELEPAYKVTKLADYKNDDGYLDYPITAEDITALGDDAEYEDEEDYYNSDDMADPFYIKRGA
jgi:hypothetical protein